MAISVDLRDGHEMLRLLLPTPRSLCASPGNSPHLTSREPVQPTTARVPLSRDNFPGGTHGVRQAVAMYGSLCCCRLALRSYPTLPLV